MSKVEAAIRTVIDLNAAFNRHDVDRMMQLMSEDCVLETAGPAPDGSRYSGKREITSHWQEFFQRLPEAHNDIEEVFSFGDRCVMRWRFFPGVGGDKSYVRGVDIVRVKDGRINEVLIYRKA